MVVDAGAFTGEDGTSSPLIDTYNFTTETVNLGDAYQRVFYLTRVVEVFALYRSTEVQTIWIIETSYNKCKNNAACGDWFIPEIPNVESRIYLQNSLGFVR